MTVRVVKPTLPECCPLAGEEPLKSSSHSAQTPFSMMPKRHQKPHTLVLPLAPQKEKL